MFRKTVTAAALALLVAAPAYAGDDDREHRGSKYDLFRQVDRDHDRDDDRDHRRGDRRHDDRHRGHDRRDDRRDDWRNSHDNGRHYGWYKPKHRSDWRRDYPRYRYYPDYRYRSWRHSPPTRYSVSFGYRSGYELAWLDWDRYGRHDRYWRRHSYRGDYGYREGYEDGWRDASRYYDYDYGYRSGYWSRDPRGSWFFGFRIDG